MTTTQSDLAGVVMTPDNIRTQKLPLVVNLVTFSG